MKKMLLSVIALAIALPSFAQWANSGNNIINTNSGNVGIGSSAPQERLEVVGNQKLFGNMVFGSDQTAYFIHGPGNGGAIRFRTNITQGTDRGIQLGNMDNAGNWQSFMSVTEPGNIGIGTTTPQAPLDIAKPLNYGDLASILARLPEGNGAGAGTFLGVRGYDTQVGHGVTAWYNIKSFALEHSFYGIVNSSINFYRGQSGTGGSMSFNTGSNTECMRIWGDGNVGIGTGDTYGFKLAVNGNIRAKEIKVEASPWSDYVFKSDYPLPTLTEVKTFIAKNNHLPGVPSENEVTKNGINLGEMNSILLKKIEELTLYLIQLKEENQSLNQRLAKVEEEQK